MQCREPKMVSKRFPFQRRRQDFAHVGIITPKEMQKNHVQLGEKEGAGEMTTF